MTPFGADTCGIGQVSLIIKLNCKSNLLKEDWSSQADQLDQEGMRFGKAVGIKSQCLCSSHCTSAHGLGDKIWSENSFFQGLSRRHNHPSPLRPSLMSRKCCHKFSDVKSDPEAWLSMVLKRTKGSHEAIKLELIRSNSTTLTLKKSGIIIIKLTL